MSGTWEEFNKYLLNEYMENTGTLKVTLARILSKPFYINKCKNSKIAEHLWIREEGRLGAPQGFGKSDECLGAEVAGVVASPAPQWH